MASLPAKLARAVGLALLAALAIWFSPLLLLQKLRMHPESSDPEYLYYKRLKLERKKRWLFSRHFDRWDRQQKRDRWKRIEKRRKTFYS